MARRKRGRGSEQESILEAAQLYAAGMIQSEIAKTMGTGQGTVSRWIKDAKLQDILIEKKLIVPPPVIDAEKKLRQDLELDDVSVVPDGPDAKNIKNLSARAARVLADAIRYLPATMDEISIVFSCGETIRGVLHSFFKLLDYDEEIRRDLKKRRLRIFPATLYADYALKSIYPATLVAMFDVLAVDYFDEDRIVVYAPTLPRGFYKMNRTHRQEYCTQYGIDEIVEGARNADIFVLGVGTVASEEYKEICVNLHEPVPAEADLTRVPEILYIPLHEDGSPYEQFSAKVIGVTVDDLLHAKNRDKIVMAVVGGKDKQMAMRRVAKRPCFNTIVTDVVCAAGLLATQ